MYVEHPITDLAMHRLFVFDFKNRKFPGWFVPFPQDATCMKLHRQTDMEILYVQEGRFSITVNSVQRTVGAGDIVIVNPNDSHSGIISTAQDKASYHMLKINLEKLAGTAGEDLKRCALNLTEEKMKFINFIPADTAAKYRLYDFINTVITSTEFDNDAYRISAFGGICMLFSTLIINGYIQKTAEVLKYIMKKNAFVSDMLNYFEKNWNKPVTSKNAAKEFSYSQEYFCKIFRQNMGKTFSEFLVEIKIHKAKEYLDSGVKAGQVMEMIGMNNYSYFYRSFKKFYGFSPEYFQRKTK